MKGLDQGYGERPAERPARKSKSMAQDALMACSLQERPRQIGNGAYQIQGASLGLLASGAEDSSMEDDSGQAAKRPKQDKVAVAGKTSTLPLNSGSPASSTGCRSSNKLTAYSTPSNAQLGGLPSGRQSEQLIASPPCCAEHKDADTPAAGADEAGSAEDDNEANLASLTAQILKRKKDQIVTTHDGSHHQPGGWKNRRGGLLWLHLCLTVTIIAALDGRDLDTSL